MSRRLVEGQTGPVDKQLKVDGVALNLAGCTVGLVLKNRLGVGITTTGKVTVTEEATGKVRFSPGATDLSAAASPYGAHWQVTDGPGKIHFFPSDDPEPWTVHHV
jgi:hypothetical protein